MAEGKQTVAGAYAKIDAHEDLCAERYRVINQTLTDMKALVKMAAIALIGVLFTAVLGLLAQLYRIHTAQAAPAVGTMVVAPSPAALPNPQLVK